MILNDSHLSLSTANDITQICTPFFEATNINSFGYVRIFKNGSIMTLNTNKDFLKYYYEKEYYKPEGTFANCITPGNHLLSFIDTIKPMVVDAKKYFGIDNMYEIVTNYTDYYEILRFSSSTTDNEIMNKYLNHNDLFQSFKFYFLEKAEKIIENAVQPGKLIDLSKYIDFTRKLSIVELNKLSKMLTLATDKIHFGKYKNQFLTKREFECLYYYLKGKNSIEAGQKMYISEKTVRYHIKNIFTKMEVNDKSELITKASKLGLAQLKL